MNQAELLKYMQDILDARYHGGERNSQTFIDRVVYRARNEILAQRRTIADMEDKIEWLENGKHPTA